MRAKNPLRRRWITASLAAFAGVALIAGASARTGALPQQSGVVDLLTQANVRLEGVAKFDLTGTSVAAARDVNGDGIGDVIVGAANANKAYVVFGRPSMGPVSLSALGSDGLEIDGTPGVEFGFQVAGAGDLNGDGLADVIVAAPFADNGAGAVYVVFGRRTGGKVDVANPGSGFEIKGAASGDNAGSSVAGGSDVNGDGRPDVIVGAPAAPNQAGDDLAGIAYVVYGFGTPELAYDPLTGIVGAKIAPHGPRRLKRTGEPSFSVGPALPAGLTLDAKTGVLSGTPQAAQAKTSYTVTMTDLTGQAKATLSIEVRDTTPPKLVLGAPASERLLAQKGVLVKASCDEACSLTATGSVAIRHSKLKVALRAAHATLAAAGSRTLKLVLSSAASTRLGRLLRAGNHAVARITVRAVDRAGNASSSTRVVTVRR